MPSTPPTPPIGMLGIERPRAGRVGVCVLDDWDQREAEEYDDDEDGDEYDDDDFDQDGYDQNSSSSQCHLIKNHGGEGKRHNARPSVTQNSKKTRDKISRGLHTNQTRRNNP